MKACLKARPIEPGRQAKALHLRAEGRYNPEYWMHIEIPAASTLDDLDDFLRQTWLECCHHMSCFTIDGQRYAYEPYNESFSGRREKSMEAKLYKVLQPGVTFEHEYDYGSTTNLALRVLGEHEMPLPKTGVRVLARNIPPDIKCCECKKPATVLDAGCGGLDPEHCFCEACADEIEEGMALPIVNSPRVGVCGYCG